MVCIFPVYTKIRKCKKYDKQSWFPNMADVFRGLGQKSTLYLFLAIILESFILRRDNNHSGSVSSNVSQLHLANSVSFDSILVSIHLWTKRSSYKTNSSSCCNTQLRHLAKDVLFVNLVLLCGDVLQNPGPATLKCFKCSKTIRKNQGRATCVGFTQPYHLKCLSAEFEYSSKCVMCFNNAPMPHEDLIETAIHGFAELSEAVNQLGLRFLHQKTAISRKVVGKNVRAKPRKVIWDMLKNTLFLTTVAVEPSFGYNLVLGCTNL